MKVNAKLIRKAMLSRPDIFKAITLTSLERDVVLVVKIGRINTSVELSSEMNMTTQQVSTMLKRCYDKGYLKRRRLNDPTGGHLWLYWCTL